MALINIARILAVFGLGILLAAGILFIIARLNIPFGNLPGDFVIKKENFTCAIPLVSSLIISILLTILVNLLMTFLRK